MKRGGILSVFIILLTEITGYSSSLSSVKETRDVSGFTKVSFGVSGNLYINLGNEFKVVLEGESSLLENIVTEVTNGNLIIKMKNWRLSLNEKVTVNITMPAIRDLGVSGSGKVEIVNGLSTDDLSLSVSGSGKLITSNIEATIMKCSISGSGDIILGGKGKISEADLSISGSGNYTGEDAELGTAEISISGSGDCSCNVTSSLRVRISGSGNVFYDGNPKVDARISGSGKVRSK